MERVRPVGIYLILCLLLLFGNGCERVTDAPEAEEALLPRVEGINSITVYEDSSGSELARISDSAIVNGLLAELEAAEQVSFDDLKPLGRLLRIEMNGTEHSATVYINDLRETGSREISGKLYSAASAKQGKSWRLSSGLIERFLRGDEGRNDSEPWLFIETLADSGDIVVHSNRPLKEASVPEAIEATLEWKTWDEQSLARYEIYWSDSQRFVVHVEGLKAGEGIRFRLDDVRTESDETFTAEGQPYRNTAVLEVSLSNRMVFVDIEKNGARVIEDTSEAVHVQPVTLSEGEAERPYAIVYEREGGHRLIPLGPGEPQPIRIEGWPEHGTPFGNDYGYEPLFSDRFCSDRTYAVYGNRTLYALNWRTGETSKLYDSPQAVYGVAASPSGDRIALLTASDEYIGPEADLLLLNSKGRKLASWPRAAYISHSDGFLFPYPLTWPDEDTVAVPIFGRGDTANGKAFVDVKRGTGVPLPIRSCLRPRWNCLGGRLVLNWRR
ncbi:hypothetical protein ABEX25_26270 [Paenibacillus thiaminolyticus]|uniref:hypothetical protein n=1 Tax=Paenibacillus thiaminolyticus TaxID=49283 RepID=UPI003D2CE3C2